MTLGALSALATTFTFTSEADMSQTKDGFTVTLGKGSGNNDPAVYNGAIRMYANNTITVSGNGITNIHLSFSKQGSKEYATLTASVGNLVSGGVSASNEDVKTDVWTGSAESVTFTLGASGQRIITQLVINGDGSEDPDPSDPNEPSTPDTPSTLDPNYVYSEPTTVTVPSTTVQGDAYKFVQNNIEVSCTKGAITDSYFSAHAGFDMTFTATKAIKGIVINGFVKKDFTATATSGDISYLSPGADTSADPVVVITDVDAKTVTISCVKQLRCNVVEIYFEENPDATVSGGSSGNGDEVVLTFDTADAVYESEFSELIEEPNYSIYLYNESDPLYIYFALDLYPAQMGVLAGNYSWADYSLGDYTYYSYGEGDYDLAVIEDGVVSITKSGDIYTITGTILADNSTTYKISFTGEMPIYTDDEYYGDESGVIGIAADKAEFNSEAPKYDLTGRKIGKGFRGIYIQDGKKFIAR